MKVDQTAIRVPAAHQGLRPGIIQGLTKAQPPAQAVAGPSVVAGEDLKPTQAPQKHVLGRPPADTPKPAEPGSGRPVIGVDQTLEVEAPGDCPGQFQDSPGLLPAEAQGPQLGLVVAEQVFRPRERPKSFAGGFQGRPERLSQPVNEADAEVKADLLTGNGINQRLEYGRKSGRLKTSEPVASGPRARSEAASR